MMRITRVLGAVFGASLLATSCAPVPGGGGGGEPGAVAIAQVVPTLGYVSLDTARAFDTFGSQDLKYNHVQLSGGDPAALAALDSGDVDFAAVGSEAPLLALAEGGGEYQIVYSLMGQMSLDLTVSKKFLDKAGVSPSDPLKKRLSALKGARFGVSALGGAQERAAKWIAQYGGLDPESDIEIVNAGAPPALLAGMENDRIDAFMLTEPNGAQAEKSGFGKVLVRPGSEVDELKSFYHLVLVTRKDLAEEHPEKVTKVVSALNEANQMIVKDPEKVAAKLHGSTYKKVPTDILTNSIKGLAGGVDSDGEVTADGVSMVIKFTSDTGDAIVEEKLDVAGGEGDWWTNKFVDDAR